MSDDESKHEAADEAIKEVTESFGEYLKRHREASGKSLDEIARTTRISRRYLEAFEANDLDRFPEQAFARGFLRNYALEVGIDVDDCQHRYERFLRASMPTQIKDLKNVRPKGFELNGGGVWTQSWLLPLVGVVVCVGVISGVVWFLGLQVYETGPDLADRPTLESPGVIGDILESEESADMMGSERQDVRPSLLELKAEDSLRLLIRLDESASQEIIISAGESKVFEVFRQVEIQGVDQEGLGLTYNGQAIERTGPSLKLFNRHLFSD